MNVSKPPTLANWILTRFIDPMLVDKNYLKLHHIKIQIGVDFPEKMPSDEDFVLVNNSYVDRMAKGDASNILNESLKLNDGTHIRIIGTTTDWDSKGPWSFPFQYRNEILERIFCAYSGCCRYFCSYYILPVFFYHAIYAEIQFTHRIKFYPLERRNPDTTYRSYHYITDIAGGKYESRRYLEISGLIGLDKFLISRSEIDKERPPDKM